MKSWIYISYIPIESSYFVLTYVRAKRIDNLYIILVCNNSYCLHVLFEYRLVLNKFSISNIWVYSILTFVIISFLTSECDSNLCRFGKNGKISAASCFTGILVPFFFIHWYSFPNITFCGCAFFKVILVENLLLPFSF